MKQIEKYILWASIVSLILNLVVMFWAFSADHPLEITGRTLFQFLAHFLPNIVFGVWLAWASTNMKLSKVPWSLFALAYGIYGVAIFYILAIYYNLIVIKRGSDNQNKIT
jgi:hypothetical protein